MRGWGTWLLIALGACLASLWSAPLAAAATTYRSVAWPGCGGGFNSGGFDSAGRTYVPCGNPSTIGVYDRDGALVQSIPLGRYVTDVEPVGDGRLLYLAGPGAPQRLVRTAGGEYELDATWSAERYPMYGTTYPAAGYFVDSDAAGNVYYADGYWASGRHTVVQYAPNGRFVMRVGEYRNSWNAGTFYWALGGPAVTPDGRRMYTSEAGNNRLQIWTRDDVTKPFGATPLTFGGDAANNADRGGYCDFAGWIGKFAAPYDVNLDAAGNIYVVNTTCKQVLRFDPQLAHLTANLDVRMPDGSDVRPHGFAVAADGMVYVGENRRVLIPTESDAGTPPIPVRPPGASPVEGTSSSGAASIAPPIADTFQPPVWPASGPRRDLTANFTVRRPVMRRTRTRQLVYGTVRCNTRCTITVEARAGRTLLGTYRATWGGAPRSIVMPLQRRRAGKQVTFTIVATATDNTPVRRSRAYAIPA